MIKKSTNHKAVILTADKFEDMEVLYPLMRLREAGWRVDIASPSLKDIHGEFGYGELKPTITIDKVKPGSYSLLIIPGGSPNGAPSTIRKMEAARKITRDFFSKNKPVASVCHGPWTLVDSDVVKGRRLTSYWYDGVPKSIIKAGGSWFDQDVVVDGNLVTSRFPGDLPAFMREVIKIIG